MAELLSPGVFIEEVPSQVQTILGVSTSTLGGIGFTPKGPTDEAVLVTSFDQYVQEFGGFSRNSFLALSMAAFFSNGGARAYVVRVVPSDAVKATAFVESQTTSQALSETADGSATAYHKSNADSVLKDNSGASPLVGTSLSLRWRAAGTTSTAANVKKRDGVTNVVGDTAKTKFEGRLDPATFSGTSAGVFDAALRATDPDLDCVQSGSGNDVTITFEISGPLTKTLTFPGTDPGPVVTASTSVDGSGVFDRRTGFFSITTAAAPTTSPFTATYKKATANKVVVSNGSGVLTGTGIIDGGYASTQDGIAPNTVDLNGGGYNFGLQAGAVPHKNARMLATYQIKDYALHPISKGAWANDMRVQIYGHTDYFSAPTASYSRFNMVVSLYNSSTSAWEVQEVFEQLDMSDPTSAYYFADTVNELSNLISVDTPAGDEAPGQLKGISRSLVLVGGNEEAASQVITDKLFGGGVAPRTVTISFTSSVDSTVKTIADDGNGNLTGAIDATYTTAVTIDGVLVQPNSIDYTTGAVNFKTSVGIKVNTVLSAAYYSAVAETTHTEQFGDTTKSYTAGSDGTFTSGTYGRNQFSNPALSPTLQGIFAFNRVDELLQVIVPDFAGDVTITGDLLDYAATRATQPSGGDRFIILTVPKGSSPQEAVDWFRYTLARFSKWAAIYWPWIKVADPLANGRPLLMPPLGHVAGCYARTDRTKSVGKAPAGTVDGQLSFLLGLEYISSQGERDLLYPNRINPIISSPYTGTAIWGVRTIAAESEWLIVSTRRLFMFLEKSVYNSTQWIVFENNGAGLWSRIALQLNGFLLSQYTGGLFAGNTPNEAFFVKCDSKNNTQATIDAGQVIIDIGVAPNKPAEFVRFRFQQKSLT